MFTFRLEAVRTIRMNNEEQALMKLGQEQTLLHNQKQQLQGFIAARVEMVAALEEKKKEKVSGGFIGLYMNSILGKEQQVAALRVSLSGQEQRVREARQELNERVKERKIIDVLYDRDYAAFQEDQRKREQDESDEMAVLRYRGAG